MGGATARFWGDLSPPVPPAPLDSEQANPWLELGQVSYPADVSAAPASGGNGSAPPGSGSTSSSGDPGGDSGSGSGSGSDEGPPPPPLAPAVLQIWAYAETTGAEKAVGIRRIGGEAMPAGDCQLRVFSNGNTQPYRTFEIPSLQLSEEIVLCTSQGQKLSEPLFPACQQMLGAAPFNGNDTLTVSCGGELTDTFGILGTDPGQAFTEVGLSTKDQTLIRCSPDERDTDAEADFSLLGSWVTWKPSQSRQEALEACPDLGMGGAPMN